MINNENFVNLTINIETDIDIKISTITGCNDKYKSIARFLAYYMYKETQSSKVSRLRIKEGLASFLGLHPNELKAILNVLYNCGIIIKREFDNSFYSYITICNSMFKNGFKTKHFYKFDINPHLIGYKENPEFIKDYLYPSKLKLKEIHENIQDNKLLIEIKQLEDKNDGLILENRYLKDRVKILEEIIKNL